MTPVSSITSFDRGNSCTHTQAYCVALQERAAKAARAKEKVGHRRTQTLDEATHANRLHQLRKFQAAKTLKAQQSLRPSSPSPSQLYQNPLSPTSPPPPHPRAPASDTTSIPGSPCSIRGDYSHLPPPPPPRSTHSPALFDSTRRPLQFEPLPPGVPPPPRRLAVATPPPFASSSVTNDYSDPSRSSSRNAFRPKTPASPPHSNSTGIVVSPPLPSSPVNGQSSLLQSQQQTISLLIADKANLSTKVQELQTRIDDDLNASSANDEAFQRAEELEAELTRIEDERARDAERIANLVSSPSLSLCKTSVLSMLPVIRNVESTSHDTLSKTLILESQNKMKNSKISRLDSPKRSQLQPRTI